MTQGDILPVTNPVTPDAIAQLRAHPGFAAAMRASARSVVALYESSRVLNWLMDDRARLMFGYFALHFHYARGDDAASGLTPTRMKELCAELGVCSPGRVVAMLSLMRFAGYLAPDTEVADRRHRRLIATDKFIAFLRLRWQPHFVAMVPLFPDGADILATLNHPASTRPLADAMVARIRAGHRLLAPAPDLSLFAERNAGIPIMASLIASGAADDTVPPSRPVPISISAVSRRFGVSRPHVLKLLRDAAEAGLIERTGRDGDHIVIRPPLADAARDFFAGIYLFFADCAREARAVLAEERVA